MDIEMLFRVTLLLVMLGYIVPRAVYRRRARRSNPPGEPEFGDMAESKLRLVLMGISGMGSDLLSIAWAISPAWLAWSSLALGWLRWVGVGAGVLAVWLGYLAHRTLGVHFTPTLRVKGNHRVVAQGIYGRVRHPMYASFFAILAACFLLTTSWLVGFLGVVYSLLILGRVGREERMMLDAFGDEYRRYVARTGRFFPRLVFKGEA